MLIGGDMESHPEKASANAAVSTGSPPALDGICIRCGLPGMAGEACANDACRAQNWFLVEDSPQLDRSDSLLGLRLAERYVLIGLLGTGATSRVYLAIRQPLQQRVAVKILTGMISASNRDQMKAAEEQYHRFQREAKVMARLSHPNLLTLIDNGEVVVDGKRLPFIVTEKLDGSYTLDERLTKQPLSYGDTYRLFGQILKALAQMHAQGMVHRDLKPENILLIKDSFKILDFGIAKHIEDQSSDVNITLTQSGLFVGTPLFCAPEQGLVWFSREHVTVDHRADLYSVGLMLYMGWTGLRNPYGDDNPYRLIDAKVHQGAMLFSRPEFQDLSQDKQTFLVKALQTRPEDRFDSADAMYTALENMCLPKMTLELQGLKLINPPGRQSPEVHPPKWLGIPALADAGHEGRERSAEPPGRPPSRKRGPVVPPPPPVVRTPSTPPISRVERKPVATSPGREEKTNGRSTQRQSAPTDPHPVSGDAAFAPTILDTGDPMSRADRLNGILKKLQSECPDVDACALISEDSLIISSILPKEIPELRVAGMCATLFSLGSRAAKELMRGVMDQVIIRGEQGYIVMITASHGTTLIALTTPSAKLGLVFLDMHTAVDEINKVL
jgi:serine/threonine protein kinase